MVTPKKIETFGYTLSVVVIAYTLNREDKELKENQV